jgi:hypothetical protein
MKRRIIFKLLVFLLLGAIINVAVAFGFAFFQSQLGREEIVRYSDAVWGYDVNQPIRGFDIRYDNALEWPSSVTADWPECTIWQTRTRSGGALEIAGGIKDNTIFYQGLWRYGWPCCSLEAELRERIDKAAQGPTRTSGVIAGFPFDRPIVGPARIDMHFPLRPIWPGFAINTIFYAAIVWVLFAVPATIRRRVRRKRGQCAACGYSLRESVSEKCPECGAAVKTA